MIRPRRSASTKIEIPYIPHSIGPYLLDKEIGSGSFSIVYRAFLKKANKKRKDKNELPEKEELNELDSDKYHKRSRMQLFCQTNDQLITRKNKKTEKAEKTTSFIRSKSFSTIRENQIPKYYNDNLYNFTFNKVKDNNISDDSDDSKNDDFEEDFFENSNVLPKDGYNNRDKNHLYYAIKIYPKSNLESQDDEELFQREINAMAFFHHKNIISLKDILSDDYNFYLVMDYCQGLDLKQYIAKNAPDGIEEKTSSIIFRQIVSAVSYCHTLGVAHRDLKPENILITTFPNIKISDFGLCGYINENQLMRTFCGSPCYSAPECLNRIEYDGMHADTWSLGVILYTMVTGTQPWPINNSSVMIKNIIKGKYTVPKNISQSCKSLIHGMLNINPKERLTINQILDHPWINQCENLDKDEDENENDNFTIKVKSDSEDSENSESSDNFMHKIKKITITTSKSMTLAEFSEASLKMNKNSDHGIYYPFTFVTEKNINSSTQDDENSDDDDMMIDSNENIYLPDEKSTNSQSIQNGNSNILQFKISSKKKDPSFSESSNSTAHQKHTKLPFPTIKKQRKKPRRSDISSNKSFFSSQNDTFTKTDEDNSVLKEEKDEISEKHHKPQSSNLMNKKNNYGLARSNSRRPQSQKVLKFPKRSNSHFNLFNPMK
ncbi:hypothetical protein M9Y10_011329 [Tritrichomonas musculus]|uniref:Protein kinase domain-containing protein n=1 Tax=Tritrichomonas musculus TaxID=1915356 RepID=A0ABR2IJB3_9EUKA